jgi:hypothetical protein
MRLPRERRSQPAPAGVGERQHGRADARHIARLPGDGRGSAGVHRHHSEVEVRVGAGPLAGLTAAVGEHDGHLLAADVVGIGQHVALADHHAGSEAPAPPEPDDRGTYLLCDPRDRVLQRGKHFHLVTPL